MKINMTDRDFLMILELGANWRNKRVEISDLKIGDKVKVIDLKEYVLANRYEENTSNGYCLDEYTITETMIRDSGKTMEVIQRSDTVVRLSNGFWYKEDMMILCS